MRNGKKQSEKLSDKPQEQALLEGLLRFIGARLSHSNNVVRSAKASVRSLAFSREIANKNYQLTATDVYGFLKSLFGDELMTEELPGFRGSLVYKDPGKTFHQSIYTWFVESVLSLTVNKLTQYFGVWLNQPYTIRMLSDLEGKDRFIAQLQMQSGVEKEFLSKPFQGRREPAEPYEVFRIAERALQAIYAKEITKQNAQDSRLPSVQTIHRVYAAARADESARELEMSVPVIKALLSRAALFSQPEARGRHFDWAKPQAVSRNEYRHAATGDSFVTASFEPMALAFSARDLAEKIEEIYSTKPLTGSAQAYGRYAISGRISGDSYRLPAGSFASRSPETTPDKKKGPLTPIDYSDAPRRRVYRESVQGWPDTLTRIEKWFEQKHEAGLSFTKTKTSSLRPEDSVLLGVTRNHEAADDGEVALALLSNRELIVEAMRARKTVSEDQHNGLAGGFTFLRREEQMRPSLQPLAYAQPARPIIEEERVVKRVREKEIVEVVRKQVETVMKSRSPIDGLSRSDYSRIADHVYSSLARRLLMEKERSGFRS